MAKIKLLLIGFLIISCDTNKQQSFIDSNISIRVNFENGAKFTFPINSLSYPRISNDTHEVILSKTEIDTIIQLFYLANIEDKKGEEAIIGTFNHHPRPVDYLSIYKDNKFESGYIILARNLKNYLTTERELKIFNLRDYIYSVLQKKEVFNKFNKIELKKRDNLLQKDKITL